MAAFIINAYLKVHFVKQVTIEVLLWVTVLHTFSGLVLWSPDGPRRP